MTSRLYGITHDAESREAVVRVPRVYKVGIGVPKGPDILPYITRSGDSLVWMVKWRKNGAKDYTYSEFPNMAEARKAYREFYPQCAARQFPEKLPHFTFTKLGADNNYYPAWDAIEANGPLPTEIDIVFNDNEPLRASYQRWGAGKLKCSGNGIDALRSIEWPERNQDEMRAAAEARAKNQRVFQIVNGCYTRGCQYAKPPAANKRAECMPHATLEFHLVRAPRLGAISRFDTTSIRSINNLFSCLDSFYRFTGNGDPSKGFVAGIPLKLVLLPFTVVVPGSGKASKAYAVQIEFRAETIKALREKLFSFAKQWHSALELPAAPIQNGIDKEMLTLPSAESEGVEAAIMNAEFVDEAESGQASDPNERAATQADDRVAQLAREAESAINGTAAAKPPTSQLAADEEAAAEDDVVAVDDPAEAASLFEDFGDEGGNAADPDDSSKTAAGRRRRK